MSHPASAAVDHFRGRFGTEPVGVFSAPGRVNLIGEHTDYNAGLVLPFAIDARAWVAIGTGTADRFRVTSAQRRDTVHTASRADLRPGSAAVRGWPAYPFGMIWALAAAGYPVEPVDLALHSAVPVGAGLSSSAAVECAVGLAVSTFGGLDLPPAELARIAQRAENDFVGVPCGLMDQMASASCQEGHALFFDVGADTTEQIPFDPAAAGLSVLVIDTRAHHSLADGEYAKRRADCERAARILGVGSLSDIGPDRLEDALGRLGEDLLRRRVRHVVTENERVQRVVERLRAGALDRIGADLTASHASLRDDFEVSAPELDAAVDAALTAGALGARMTGGGFGGSVIALVPRDLAHSVADAARDAFAGNDFGVPEIREVWPAQGARRDL
jgi:galactokinase